MVTLPSSLEAHILVGLEQELIDLSKALLSDDANESDTRLKLINRVLFEVLGWRHDDVQTEHRVADDGKTQITDFFFRTAATLFVLEAKRIGRDFKNVSGKKRFLLSDANLMGELGDAVRQAREFCQSRHVPFAVATNGDVWIIFPAVRTDGVLFSASSAIIFESLEDALVFQKEYFLSLLERNAVLDGSLDRALLGKVDNQIDSRRLNHFFETSTPRGDTENIFQLVESEFVLALSPDISDENPALLRDSYVDTPSRTRFDSRIQMHIRKRESVSPKSPIRPMKKGEANRVSDLIKGAAASARPIAVLVLGQVGAGKSTFLKYTRLVSAADLFEAKTDGPYPQWIALDFKDFSKSQNVRTFMMEKLFQYVQTEPFLSDGQRCVRHAFKNELDALLRGPLHLFQQDEAEKNRQIAAYLLEQFKRVEPYVLTILKYAANHASIFLVIDNVDQIENNDVQNEIFSEVMALAHECRVNPILAMRDATYVKSKSSATFDAFDFDPILIEAPPVESVLSKRFQIVDTLLAGKEGNFTPKGGASLHFSDLRTVSDLLRRSILGSEIGHQIEILATGDIRLALRMTREFLQYGYTATARAFRLYRDFGEFSLPPHEALKAIMLGNQSVYKEAFSVLGNPFDAHLNRTEFQLARMYILSALVAHASEASFQFATGNEIVENCGKVGIPDGTVLKVLEDLARYRFVQTLSHGPASLESNYIPSRLGGHIVRRYIGSFTFVENVMMDTFIPEDTTWRSLKELSERILKERNIVSRLSLRHERARIFHDLMHQMYLPLVSAARLRALPNVWCTDAILHSKSELQRNFQLSLESAKKNYGAG